MNHIWQLDISTYIEIMESAILLGKEKGKVVGDNLEQEFFECAKQKELIDKIKYLGESEMDRDLIIGNLRENGVKVFDPKEEERKK
jgi:hypothetical protein